MAIIWRESPEVSSASGATPEALVVWSKAHKLELPATLKAALFLQNGGVVADTNLRIHPLGELKTVNNNDWSDIQACNEIKPSDRPCLIEFAEDEQSYQRFFLDFADGHRPDAPSIWGYWSDAWSIERVAASLEEFIAAKCNREIPNGPSDETASENSPQDVGRKPDAASATDVQRLKAEVATRYATLTPQQQEKVHETLKKNEFQIMSGNSVISADMEPEVANVIEWLSQLMRKNT